MVSWHIIVEYGRTKCSIAGDPFTKYSDPYGAAWLCDCSASEASTGLGAITGFGVSAFSFEGLGFRGSAQGLGFRVLGFRVLGFRV